MTKRVRVQVVWWALFGLYVVPVAIFKPFTAFGWPIWLAFVTGALVGLLLRGVAEYVVYRYELAESNRRFRAAWRKAMDDGKGKGTTVID